MIEGSFDQRIMDLCTIEDTHIRMCDTPDQVAIVAFMLATYVSDFMVGQTINVDGGAMFHMPKVSVRTLGNE